MSTSSVTPIITPARAVSAALPSVPRPRSTNMFSDLVGQKMLVVFLVLAVVVVVVLCWLARCYSMHARRHGWPSWCHSSALAAVLLAAVFLVAAWATYRAYATGMNQNLLLGLFVAVALVYVLAFYQFFYEGSAKTAFYLMVLATVLTLVHLWFAWKSGDQYAMWGCVPLAVFSAVVAWMFWRASCHGGYGGKGGKKGDHKGGYKGYQQTQQQDQDQEEEQ